MVNDLRLRNIFIIVLLFHLSVFLSAQEKYWIFFKDKKDCSFDPFEYFNNKAIERRVRLGIPIADETDLPLNKDYIKEIEKICGHVFTQSRWLNAVSVRITQSRLEEVKNLGFVKDVKHVELYEKFSLSVENESDSELSEEKLELLTRQTGRMGADVFEKHGIDGRGVRIAVFDGGFPGVDTSPFFEHLRKEGRIIDTYDFVRKRVHAYGGVTHGTMVLSCIAGIYQDKKMGLATGAEFLLARTEKRSEPFSEEENWLAAVEWADKNGADIINSSLGYTYHRYFPAEMDGKTSLVVKAANIAAKKGILVVNAMGNDGNKPWEFLGTPADADSIISVGGIDPKTDYHISFSAFGPTSDMRRKPNVSAYGEVIAAKELKLVTVQGTSFASPLVAGFAACIMQMNPELSNFEIFNLIEESGHLYPYYDYAHGYGIPQAAYFFNDTVYRPDNICLELINDTILVKIDENIRLEEKSSDNLLYYHIENEKGILDKYWVIEAFEHDILKLPVKDISGNSVLRVHFRGTTIEHKFIAK